MHTHVHTHTQREREREREREITDIICYQMQVNGIEMTGKSQTEAVTVLRNTKMGSVVNIVVSRQVLENEENKTQDDSAVVQKVGFAYVALHLFLPHFFYLSHTESDFSHSCFTVT